MKTISLFLLCLFLSSCSNVSHQRLNSWDNMNYGQMNYKGAKMSLTTGMK